MCHTIYMLWYVCSGRSAFLLTESLALGDYGPRAGFSVSKMHCSPRKHTTTYTLCMVYFYHLQCAYNIVLADEIGNNCFGPYKQPYRPRRLSTMHVTEKLYVHAKPAIPCVLRVNANVRSTISCLHATDFSFFTWQTMCQWRSHVKDRLEFRDIHSILKLS